MTEKDIIHNSRLIRHNLDWKKIKERNHYFIKEIDKNTLLSNINKKVCTTLNYIDHFITLVFAVTVYISIFAFIFLVNISKGTVCDFYNRIKYLCNNCKT